MDAGKIYSSTSEETKITSYFPLHISDRVIVPFSSFTRYVHSLHGSFLSSEGLLTRFALLMLQRYVLYPELLLRKLVALSMLILLYISSYTPPPRHFSEAFFILTYSSWMQTLQCLHDTPLYSRFRISPLYCARIPSSMSM